MSVDVGAVPVRRAQVLREQSQNFVRDGRFWCPLHSLSGDSIMSVYAEWELSKRILQPAFSTRTIRALSDHMTLAINEAIGQLDELTPMERSR